MCLVKGIIKCLLGIVVGMVLTAGLILMAIGGILLWGMNSIMPKIYNVTGFLKSMLSNLKISDAGIQNVESMIAANSATIGAIAFTLGVLFTAIAVLGYISLCCLGVRCIFIVIIIIISSLLVAMVILIIVYGAMGSDKILSSIEKELYRFVGEYRGYNATNAESMIINVIQTQAHCCGIYNYTDFKASKNWFGPSLGYKFPLSCCESRDMQFTDLEGCKKTWTSPSLRTGCYSLIKPELERFLKYGFLGLGIAIGILALVDAMFIAFAICERKISK